jgi:exosortase/archaeosortase family protein
MAINISKPLRIFFKEPQWEKVRGLFWFCFITLIFHVLWRFWAGPLQFAPIQNGINLIRSFLITQVYNEILFILNHILNITVTSEPQSIITSNKVRLILGLGASGLKQMCQFIILIILFPGFWKNKIWFIPIGIIIMHFTNVFRVLCFVVLAIHWPQQIQYTHDNYLRLLFYIVIFILWLFWVEKINYLKFKK